MLNCVAWLSSISYSGLQAHILGLTFRHGLSFNLKADVLPNNLSFYQEFSQLKLNSIALIQLFIPSSHFAMLLSLNDETIGHIDRCVCLSEWVVC